MPMQNSTIIDCSRCGEPQTVPLSIYEVKEFLDKDPKERPNIQDCVPHLTPDEREMLKSMFCPKCWEEIFAESPRTAREPGQFSIDKDGRPCMIVADEPRRPHHAIPSGHSDGEGYDGGDR